ncbi:cytochrome P450 [Dactylonectria estremocensis]|uniref:Cytochrome P450 n=1 Tax=Dactylonectria estremocensis TaxID=1079267 RepID=A0A9P9IFV3_9HYPO|nr:cytochrome P450 [Dactylonectria estremocensis]
MAYNMRSVFATKSYEEHRTKRKYWYALDIITHLMLGPDHCTRSVDHAGTERDILMELKHLQFLNLLQLYFAAFYTYLRADAKLEAWCQQRALSHEYITAGIHDNINAAEATVAVTATYLIWRLTESPQWQRKIRGEIETMWLREDSSLSFLDVNDKVPSLEACLREVHRLYPASSGRAERIVPKGGHTLTGVFVPEGTIVATSVLALKSRDAQLVPFGHGGRLCLGKALAAMEIKLLIARLYLNYKMVMTDSFTAESMKQCSTHDAVPKVLNYVVKFQRVGKEF